MKKMNWKKSLTLTASAALALSLLAGCGAQPAEQSSTESKAVGTVLLSVNPEIEVEYDKSGLVLEIEGLNKDGKTVVKDVKDYQGKDCRTVVNELVREIYDDGYFEKTVDGHTKNIVLKLEEGSVYVSDEFLQDVADGVRETVQECGIDAKTMTVSEGDLDDAGHIGTRQRSWFWRSWVWRAPPSATTSMSWMTVCMSLSSPRAAWSMSTRWTPALARCWKRTSTEMTTGMTATTGTIRMSSTAPTMTAMTSRMTTIGMTAMIRTITTMTGTTMMISTIEMMTTMTESLPFLLW